MTGVKDGERQQKQTGDKHELGLTNLTKAIYRQQRSGIARVHEVVLQFSHI